MHCRATDPDQCVTGNFYTKPLTALTKKWHSKTKSYNKINNAMFSFSNVQPIIFKKKIQVNPHIL